MKYLSLALLLLLPIAPAVQSQEVSAAKQAKVEDLIRITKLDQLSAQMTSQMTNRMKTMAAQQNARQHFTPAQQKTVDDYIAQVQSITQGAVSWEKVKPLVVKIYSETYTDQELDGILTFYHSPAGQALVAKSPQLMSKTMDLLQQQVGTVQPQIQQANAEFAHKMQELSAAPATTPAPAPAPAAKP